MSLSPFVPRLALTLRGRADFTKDGCAVDEDAAVLFFDVSGFTALSELVIARYGDRGAERLQEQLNRCFGPLVDAVEDAGGEVLAFPGDAALCLFRLRPPRQTLAECVAAATVCGRAVCAKLDDMEVRDHVRVRVRAAIGAGVARLALVGGAGERWHSVVLGPPVDQLGQTLRRARRGDTLLSPEAEALLAAPVTPLPQGRAGSSGESMASVEAAAERDFVPAFVQQRLAAGLQDWIAEFRMVTAVFVRLAAPAPPEPGLQLIVRAIQGVVDRLDGSVNQIVCDDKGLTAVVAFGLPGQTHSDDAWRGVMLAMTLRDDLAALGASAGIGVATGQVFTGIRGGNRRAEFAMLGRSVVLAARLSGATDDVLVDAETFGRTSDTVRFVATGPVQLKGLGALADVWCPVSGAERRPVHHPELVGRAGELEHLSRRLATLASERRGGLVVIEGEPGIGKSALLAQAIRALPASLRCVAGAGDSIQRAAPLRGWRAVFDSLLAQGEAAASANPAEWLRRFLSDEDNELLPLLNPLLRWTVPETAHTRQLSPEARARVTRDLLLGVLRQAAGEQPLVVVLEDGHWLDSLSWELVSTAVAEVPSILVIVTMRRSTADAAPSAAALGIAPDRLSLDPMPAGDIQSIVARRIGASGLAPSLSAWIAARCEGQPLFAQELAVMLLERDAVRITDGRCDWRAGVADASLTNLPHTVRSVLAERIDRLTPDEQLVLKAASVVGRTFPVSILQAVNPVSPLRGPLDKCLERTAAAGLLARASGTDDWTFSHALIQEVAYDLLPARQRRLLHRRAAECLEETAHDEDGGSLALLAHHWENAGAFTNALTYLERAGEHALLKASSNLEAERFFTRLIRLADDGAPDELVDTAAPTPAARARWERMLAQAVARQGRHSDSMLHLERSLRLLGESVPPPGWASRTEAVAGAVARLARRPPALEETRGAVPDRAAALEAARSYDACVQLLYLGNLQRAPHTSEPAVQAAVALLRAARLGERAGPSSELSYCYTMVANLMALFRARGRALQYVARARVLAEQASDDQALFRVLTMGQLPAFVFGRWSDAEANLRKGLELGNRLRNAHDTLLGTCTLGYVAFHRGALGDARRIFEGIRTRADAFVVPMLWATVALAEIALREDQADAAAQLATECLTLARARESIDQNSLFQAHGVLASVRTRQGRLSEAREHAERAITAAEAGAYLSFSAQSGFVGVADALLASLPAEPGAMRGTDTRQLLAWLRRLRMTAVARPILQPWSLHFAALWQHRRTRRRRAQWQMARAVRAAVRLGMPYEAERSRLALAAMRVRLPGPGGMLS